MFLSGKVGWPKQNPKQHFLVRRAILLPCENVKTLKFNHITYLLASNIKYERNQDLLQIINSLPVAHRALSSVKDCQATVIHTEISTVLLPISSKWRRLLQCWQLHQLTTEWPHSVQSPAVSNVIPVMMGLNMFQTISKNSSISFPSSVVYLFSKFPEKTAPPQLLKRYSANNQDRD